MLINNLLCCGALATIMSMLSACSAVEYVGQQKYKVVASPLAMDRISNTQNVKGSSLYKKDRVQLLSVKKSSNKSLGSIYFRNGFSNKSSSDIVFELSRDRYGYKAATPLFFQSETTSGRLAFTVRSFSRMMAGIEFTIKLPAFK